MKIGWENVFFYFAEFYASVSVSDSGYLFPIKEMTANNSVTFLSKKLFSFVSHGNIRAHYTNPFYLLQQKNMSRDV